MKAKFDPKVMNFLNRLYEIPLPYPLAIEVIKMMEAYKASIGTEGKEITFEPLSVQILNFALISAAEIDAFGEIFTERT